MADRSSNNICTNKIQLPDAQDDENFENFFCSDGGFCCELQEWRPIHKYCHICAGDNTHCCPQIYCCHEEDPKDLTRITTAAPKKSALGDANRIGSYYVYLVLGIGVVLVAIICLNEWVIAKKRQRRRVHAENVVLETFESPEEVPGIERMRPLPGFLSTNGDYMAGNFGNDSAGTFESRRALTPPPPYSP